MSQLRRMLLSNVGYRSAYYSGVLLNFCNAETQQPENTVIWLANQGGKTTLISLLFTNIEPAQGRFVQHLQKQDHHFSDYFYSSPGIVVLELKIGGADLMGSTPALVIGQCVIIQDNGQVQRVFFGFSANESINLESLPFKGAASNKNPQSLSDFKAWLEEAQKKNSTVFITQIQSEWKAWLNTQGVEHELLAKQIDFCRSEGGISEFASFKNERVFLEQFFSLALDEKMSNQAEKELRSAHKQYKEIPILEEQMDIYSKLLKGFEGLKPYTDKYLAYSNDLADHNKQLKLQVKQIHLKKQWLNNEIDEFKDKLKKIKNNITEKQDKLSEIRKYLEQISFTIHVLNHKKAKESLGKEKEKLKKAKEQLILIKAVIAYNKLQDDKIRVDTLKQTINASNKDIEPVEIKLKNIGSQLIESYQSKIKNLHTNIDSIENEIYNINNSIKVNEENIKKWEIQLKEKEQIISKADQWFNLYEQGYENLKNNQHLVIIDETELDIYQTQIHWDDKKIQQAKEIKQFKSIKKEKSDEVKLKASENDTLIQEIAILETKLKQLKGDKKNALNECSALEKSPQLCKLIQMAYVNPDDKALLSKLMQSMARLDRLIRENQEIIHGLEIQKEWLEKDRLQKPEPHIERALEWLESKGIEANYYPHYLGKQQLSAHDVKILVESDPARFYGIQVNNLSIARNAIGEINREELGLSQPVIVSVACTEIERQHDDLVLPVRNDAAYNEEAAKDLLNSISQKLDDLEVRQLANRMQYNELIPIQKQLEAYQARYNKAWFDKNKQQIDYKTIEKAQKEEKQSIILEAIDEINQLVEVLGEQIVELIKSRENSKLHYSTISNFINNFEDKKINKRKEKDDAEALLKSFIRKIELASESIITLKEDLIKKEKVKKDFEEQVNNTNKALGKITYNDDKLKLQPVSLNELSILQAQYDANIKIYNALMSESKLSELKGELKGLSKNLEKAQESYLDIKGSFTDNEVEIENSKIEKMGKTLAYEKQLRERNKDTRTTAIGACKVEYENYQKALDGFKKNHLGIIALEEPLTLPDLDDLQETKEKEKEDIERDILTYNEKNALFTKQKQNYTSERDKIRIGLKSVPDNLLIDLLEDKIEDSIKSINSNELIDEISQLLKSKSNISKQREKIKNKVNDDFSKNILPIVQDSERSKCIGGLAIDIRGFSRDQLITDAKKHIPTMRESLNMVKSKIERNKHKLLLTNSSFNRLLDDADDALHKAFRVGIPNDMLHYSGKKILKSSLTTKDKLSSTLSVEQRESLYFDHLSKMVEEKSVDEDGFKLAASFLLEAYKRTLPAEKIKKKTDILNIRIIKPHDVAVEYIPVNKMVGSGGEGLTAGLLLYLVIAKISGEQMGQGGIGKTGSFLLLDNPFSKANKVDLIRPQTQLAKKLNIQLIFATGIEDLNAIGEFEHIIRLRKDRMDSQTKRQYIEHEEQIKKNSEEDFENLDRYKIEPIDYSFNHNKETNQTNEE